MLRRVLTKVGGLSAVLCLASGVASAQSGIASYYWEPQPTASGEKFNPHGMTAAHKTLPFGTKVKVTDKRSGRSVVVRINDRGPYVNGRIIDLSLGAAKALGITDAGLANVEVEPVGPDA